MSTSTVYGVRIKLNDRSLPVTMDSDIGLYNRIFNLTTSIPKDVTTINVATLSLNLLDYDERHVVTIRDAANSESNIITNVSSTTGIVGLLWPTTQAYNVSATGRVQADSVFQLIQNDITGLTESWKSGILMENGIDSFSRKIDLKRMGNIAIPGNTKIEVKNTNRFQNKMSQRGVFFNGLVARIFKFSSNESMSVKASQWLGECEKPTWTTKRFKIPVHGIYNKRIANPGILISNDATSGNFKLAGDDRNGEMIPITLGEMFPITGSLNRYAKLIRTSEKQTVYTNYKDASNYCIPSGANVFPLVAYGDDVTEAHLVYKIQFGSSVIGAFTSDLSEKYIQVVVGGASDGTMFTGKYRKIVKHASLAGNATSGSPIITGISDTKDIVVGTKVFCSNGFVSESFDLTVLSKTATTITVDANADATVGLTVVQGYYFIGTGLTALVVLESFFEKDLVVNAAATADYNAWVQIVNIPFEYNAETVACKGFVDEDGDAIVNTDYPRLAVHTDAAGFAPISNYGYKSIIDSLKNKISINLEMFDGSPDQLISFDIFPLKNLTKFVAPNLDLWEEATLISQDSVENIYAVVESPLTINSNLFENVPSSNSIPAFDKDDATEKRATLNATKISGLNLLAAIAFECEIDLSKILIEYSNYYLGIKLESHISKENYGFQNTYVKLKYRRFMGFSYYILSNTLGAKYCDDGTLGGKIDNLPDFYFLNRTCPDSNKAFRFNPTVVDQMRAIFGYTNFQLIEITNINQLKSIYKIGLILYPMGDQVTATPFEHLIKIYELSLICKSVASIANELYGKFSGRIFNNTWGSRKTWNSLISNPVDVLELFCRLQQGSENDFTDALGWGKSYWKNALIKTAGDGSFDDTTDANFVALKSMNVSGQILNYDDAWTNIVKRKLCYQFGMANWIDKDGNECVKSIRKATLSPADTITINDIVDRSSIQIIEPDSGDIYTEPFVRYNKNMATGNFDSIIKMTNVDFENPTAAQKLSFVIGCQSQATAVYVYDRCVNLMKRVHATEPPPSDMTDLDFVYDYDTAMQHLIDWCDWMYNPEIELRTSATKVDGWEECHRFKIQLPHHTGNVLIECILEDITINPNGEHEADIKAIMFSDTIPDGFSFQDSLEIIGQLWQDTLINTNPGKQGVL